MFHPPFLAIPMSSFTKIVSGTFLFLFTVLVPYPTIPARPDVFAFPKGNIPLTIPRFLPLWLPAKYFGSPDHIDTPGRRELLPVGLLDG